MSSLTVDIGLKALNTLLNRKPSTTSTASSPKADEFGNTVRFFHKVLFRHALNKTNASSANKSLQYSSATNDIVVDTLKAPLLYLCFCEHEVLLVDPFNIYVSYKPNFGPGSSPYKPVPALYADASGGVNPHIIFAIPYHALGEVVADTTREEVFGIGLEYDEDTKLPYEVPAALRFSYSFRKQLVEDLQICHNVFYIISLNQAKQLPVRFAALDRQQAARIQRDQSVSDKRLAAFQYFSSKRLPPEYHDARVFYRSDYMFLGPAEMTDRYEALPNRPCSTYMIETPETKLAQLKGRVADHPRLIVKLLPQRPMTDLTSLTRGRDALGMNLITDDDDIEGVALSQAGQTELEFQFWVESIAHALAMNEEHGDQFFVPEKGIYHKKLNVVNDKCSWECFRAHVFTKTRQIGVIGCRRSYLPPYADAFQDMLFVLYGPRNSPLVPDPSFMNTLELIVDTLSPACAPLPFKDNVSVERLVFEEQARLTNDHFQNAQHAQTHGQNPQTQSITNNAKRAVALYKAKQHTVHRTFMDRDLIQARANTLLYTPKQFHWLSTRDWLTEPNSTIQGVVPRTKFIDVECYSLAIKFCVSVLAKITGAQASNNVKEEFKPVADPLAIIFRMMAELDQEHETTDNSTARLVTDLRPKDENGYSVKEEWKARIAQYFAFCVNGGLLPDELTLTKLVTSDVVDERAVDQIVDFLLYMRKKPKSWRKTPNGFPFEQHDSVLERILQTDILNGFTCNEDVLVTLIQAGYFENLAKRHNKPEVLSRLFRSILLTKHYNLKLIRTVCRKIATIRMPNDQVLIDPLVNLAKVANFYVKADALHALAALAAHGHDLLIFERGGVGMAIWSIYTSRSGELLEASLDLIIAVAHANKLGIQPYAVLTQPDLARKLIHLLAPFEKSSALQERYHPYVLERVATLMIKLAADRSVLLVLIENLGHVHLARLVEHSSRYHHILVKVTSAIGTLYLHAGPLITRPRYTNRVQQERTAICLVDTLRTHCTSTKVQLCLNILIVLRMMLDFWLVPLGTGDKAYKKYWPCVQDRVDLLFKLKDVASFDLVLDRCKLVAEEVSSHALTNKTVLENSNEYQDLSDKEKAMRRMEWDTMIKLANGILAKYNWFVACAQYCNSRQRTTKNFQHDGKQLHPLTMGA